MKNKDVISPTQSHEQALVREIHMESNGSAGARYSGPYRQDSNALKLR